MHLRAGPGRRLPRALRPLRRGLHERRRLWLKQLAAAVGCQVLNRDGQLGCPPRPTLPVQYVIGRALQRALPEQARTSWTHYVRIHLASRNSHSALISSLDVASAISVKARQNSKCVACPSASTFAILMSNRTAISRQNISKMAVLRERLGRYLEFALVIPTIVSGLSLKSCLIVKKNKVYRFSHVLAALMELLLVVVPL